MIPSGPGAFLVFTFFKASFSFFMLKGSVIEQSCSSPYDDRMMFFVDTDYVLVIMMLLEEIGGKRMGHFTL